MLFLQCLTSHETLTARKLTFIPLSINANSKPAGSSHQQQTVGSMKLTGSNFPTAGNPINYSQRSGRPQAPTKPVYPPQSGPGGASSSLNPQIHFPNVRRSGGSGGSSNSSQTPLCPTNIISPGSGSGGVGSGSGQMSMSLLSVPLSQLQCPTRNRTFKTQCLMSNGALETRMHQPEAP